MPSPSVDRLFGANSSLAIKAPVRVGTTGAITLSGEQTIDGVAVIAGDRVLVKNQGNSVFNGIYVADTSAWNRAPDFDGARDVVRGSTVLVANGTTLTETWWWVTNANPIIIGTTDIVFELWPWTSTRDQWLQFAIGDQTTVVTAGAAKFTTRFPGCTVLDVRGSLKDPSTSGVFTFDINEGPGAGNSILSTKLTIDAGERTSTTAVTPAVISDATISDDAQVTFDIDAAGANAVGPVVSMHVRWDN